MITLRTIKLLLAVVIALFVAATAYLSALVIERQQALEQVSRYNVAWLVSQAATEYARLEQRVSAFAAPGAGVSEDEVQLRFDIILNRLRLLDTGEVEEFLDSDKDHRNTVHELQRAMASGLPLAENIGRAGNAVLVSRVLQAVGPAPGVVLELYAGSGNFTRELAAVATRLLACEGDPSAVARGRRAAPRAEWSGRLPDIAADVVVLDPPREGADAAHLAAATRARRRVVYVSCDPQTLARDARRIVAAGFRLTRALAIDLMPQTFHVEVVAVFDRNSGA